MTTEELGKLLETSGLPVAYNAFPIGDAPALPFICYLYDDSNVFYADGEAYWGSGIYMVELYTKVKSPDVERAVEAVLNNIPFIKTETYLEDEKCFQIIYEIEV